MSTTGWNGYSLETSLHTLLDGGTCFAAIEEMGIVNAGDLLRAPFEQLIHSAAVVKEFDKVIEVVMKAYARLHYFKE